jgi:pyruvate formate-lyase/glycerol dehydratase family glycyl radical enzyme
MTMPLSNPTLEELLQNPVCAFPPDQWDANQLPPRLAQVKARLLNDDRQIDIERARLTTESYQQTAGEPMVIRRARMLLHLAQHLSITIAAEELIVGNRSLLPRMGVIAPEGAVEWVDKELEILATRPQDRFTIQPEHITELRETIFPYWRSQTLEDTVAARIPPHIQTVVKGKAVKLNQTDHAQGHILPDVAGWLKNGIDGYRQQIEAARQTPAHQSADQPAFYEAARITLDAAELYIKRYGDLARELIPQAESDQRRRELERIAAHCHWLARHPARDFYEALQAVWFLFVLLQIESNASSFSPGRFDQYMLPYLVADLAAGRLTLTEAQHLLESLWLKFNEIVLLRSSDSARYFAGFPIGFNLAVGGLTPQGEDATNFLSYMCLRAQADLGMTQPNLSLRIHAHSPQDFLMAAAAVIGQGSGMPQVFNDEVIIPAQMQRGVSREDALNYAIVGCVELSTPGKALGWSDAAMLNMTRILELTLFGGQDPHTGQQIGLPTPPLDQLDSFAALETAYDQQLTHFIDLMVEGCNIVDGIHAEMLPSPFLSVVIQDCIGTGQDVTAGGAVYNFSGVQGVQVANVADSLAAVKQAVYDEAWVSTGDLLAALRQNFAGYPLLQKRLVNRVPKYGNDIDWVDELDRKWADRYCDLLEGYQNVRGGIYQPGFYTVSAHVPMGAHVGATPDGRLAGAPLADGGLSPVAGLDQAGPTAMLRSVSKPNLQLAANGTLLNMKFLPAFFEGHACLEKFVGLLRGFCALKIPHVQFNVVSAAMLRAAQSQPQAHRHLVVRVAGYSAYFTELDRDLQDEIIRRTEYGSAEG